MGSSLVSVSENYSLAVVHGLLVAVASLAVEHRICRGPAPVDPGVSKGRRLRGSGNNSLFKCLLKI